MKILLDENVDVRLKHGFTGSNHQVFTVRGLGWNGVKNGALLKLMAENAFDVFIAVDKNLPYQQNLTNLPVMVLILDVKRNTLATTRPFVPLILERLTQPVRKEVIVLSLP